ncbi:MAG: M20/M25/M40 family metallo-hydrolase [Elusimicrobia bacterium]|nr:M20/M25/M40 family metallo-hydrolase [Elusimicrobiota bacterium]
MAAATSSAAPDAGFDQGVDVRPAIATAREAAGMTGRRLASSPERADDAVWISVSNADVAALKGEFDFSRRVPVSQNSLVSIFEVTVAELDALSDIMHHRLRKCGGFFAHPTLRAAKADMAEPPLAMARAYEIDQRETVVPMLKLVDEAAITETIKRLAAFKNRYYRSETGAASARWLRDYWQELSKGRPDITVELFRHGGWAQESVILTVRGKAEPGKVVVLGGHLDSIAGWGGGDNVAPGADDDASGIAVLTESARVIVASGYKPGSTVKFIAYAAEEAGLRGSREIADNFKQNGVAVQGVLQFDMTNYRGSADDIYLIADNVSEAQNAFLGKLIAAYTDYRVGTTKCGYACSDHASWTRNGYSASLPFEAKFDEDNPNIHTANDTLAQSGGNSLHAFKFAKVAVAYLVEMGK